MNKSTHHPLSNTVRLLVMVILVITLTLGTGQIARAATSPAPVNLGMAAPFVVLTKTGITTTGVTALTGNLGVSPAAATYITGFGLIADSTNTFSISSLVTGRIYAADYADPTPANLTTAVSNMETAFTDAAGRAADFTELYAGDLSGQTLTPGVYKWSSGVLITTNVTLSGPANGVWIFQIAGDLTIGSGAQVLLNGGATARNIFWQVGGGTGVEIGTTAHAEGTILAAKAIHLRTGASLNGRTLSQTEVTLDQVTIVFPAPAPASDVLVMDDGAWNKYDFATGGYLGGVWTGTAAGCTPALIDYDGDGIKEYSQLCRGAWHFYNKDGSYNKGIWVGDAAGSCPAPGDYNGDGTDEPVLFSAGAWHFFDFATATYNAALSKWTGTAPGCVPAPLDYNGDKKMEFSLFCGGAWHFYNSDDSYNKGIWIGGSASDIPAPADYDGNGTEDVVVFASGAWNFFDFATGAYDAAKSRWTGLSEASAKPAPIDYNQDGSYDFVQYANGNWYFYNADGSFNKSIATGSSASAVPMTRRFLP
jgi:hypothetical protein